MSRLPGSIVDVDYRYRSDVIKAGVAHLAMPLGSLEPREDFW